MNKIEFTKEQVSYILKDYVEHGLSCESIGKKYGVSKTPIRNLLKQNGKLKLGKSDGKKKVLTEDERNLIKKLYLDDKKNSTYIAKILTLNKHFVDKILHNSGYRRDKSESMSILKTGKKLNDSVKKNMKIAQQKLSKSGKRKQTGGVCKKFNVEGIECFGTYEKFYIEKLVNDNCQLPYNTTPIETPFGVYYPDFSFDDRLVEIKCDYTYGILIGNVVSRFTRKKESNQYEKINWVNSNLKPIDILIVDKKNDKIIKKEII
jgi:transposase